MQVRPVGCIFRAVSADVMSGCSCASLALSLVFCCFKQRISFTHMQRLFCRMEIVKFMVRIETPHHVDKGAFFYRYLALSVLCMN